MAHQAHGAALSVASPSLMSAMVAREVASREEAEQLFQQERERCRELQDEIADLEARLRSPGTRADMHAGRRCPVCHDLVDGCAKDAHAAACLRQLVAFWWAPPAALACITSALRRVLSGHG